MCCTLYPVFKEPRLRRPILLNLSGFPRPPDVSSFPSPPCAAKEQFRLRFGGALQGNLLTLRYRSHLVNFLFRFRQLDFFRVRGGEAELARSAPFGCKRAGTHASHSGKTR